MSMKDLISRVRNDVAVRRHEDDGPFLTLHRQVDRLFEDFMHNFSLPVAGRLGWPSKLPHVEVDETDKEYKIVAELPGMDEKDVDLTLREGLLTLKGEKKSETSETTKAGGHYSECWYGTFERSFDLGPDADPDKVSAIFKKGVLTVNVAKRPEAQSRVKRIPVTRD